MQYHPICEAPKDRPIIAVCGGIEAVVHYDDPAPGVLEAAFYYWDEENLCPSYEKPRNQPTLWRHLFPKRTS